MSVVAVLCNFRCNLIVGGAGVFCVRCFMFGLLMILFMITLHCCIVLCRCCCCLSVLSACNTRKLLFVMKELPLHLLAHSSMFMASIVFPLWTCAIYVLFLIPAFIVQV